MNPIVTAARACLGTPFVHQGRQPGVGLDCVGVAIHALRACGYTVTDIPGYGRTPYGIALAEAIEAHEFLQRVPDIAPGDILLMRFEREPQHIAIAGDEGTLIHAYEKVGRCVEHRLDDLWFWRVLRIYRVIA